MKPRMTNDECEHLTVRDDIWFGRERHDDYCLLNSEWCPDCSGCRFNEKDEEDDD